MILLGGCYFASEAPTTLPPQLHSEPISTAATPTLDDFWEGRAAFVVDVAQTGLPLGESDTLEAAPGKLWSYLHASHASAGVRDQCGAPVAFPGCLVLYQSDDGGRSFRPLLTDSQGAPICQLPCLTCPCNSERDHIDQQQYPRIARRIGANGRQAWSMVYEYRARVMLRRSNDGVAWTPAEELPLSGIWRKWLMGCTRPEQIGAHPYTPAEFDCLAGSPPGIYHKGDEVYIFVALGQNPGSMGCYRGHWRAPTSLLRKCEHNPLFTGAKHYGPSEVVGQAANPYFDFRTISSADLIAVGERTYMFYEGIRGAAAGETGDTQFGLGLARSSGGAIDGPWERYPNNPLFVSVPANVGIGHADVILLHGVTYLYTSLDGQTRSRLALHWK
jgi:hypothetical protein